MIIQRVVVYQSEQNGHRRDQRACFISAMPVLLLGWVFACYGPSAFYLAVFGITYGQGPKHIQNNSDCRWVSFNGVELYLLTGGSEFNAVHAATGRSRQDRSRST
jgi:hypothetical protein